MFENGAGILFVDDKATNGSEQGPGVFTSLMVWNAPSTR